MTVRISVIWANGYVSSLCDRIYAQRPVQLCRGQLPYSWNSHGTRSCGPFWLNQILLNRHVAYTLTYETCEYFPLGTDTDALRTVSSSSSESSGRARDAEEKRGRREGRLSVMAFQVVSGCEDVGGNERGRWRRGGLVSLRRGSVYRKKIRRVVSNGLKGRGT